MAYRVTLGYKAVYMPYYGNGGSLYPGHHGIDLVPHSDVKQLTRFKSTFRNFPIWVGNTLIGLMGDTGLAGGVHLHGDKNTNGSVAYSAYRSPTDWENIQGEVIFAANANTAGNMVKVKATNGHIYRFLHLNRIDVKVGQKIGKLATYQRKVRSPYVNYRKSANAQSAKIGDFVHGEVLDFKGYVIGQSIQGNNKWFVGKHSGGYIWSGSMTNKTVTGLKNITPAAVPTAAQKAAAAKAEAAKVAAAKKAAADKAAKEKAAAEAKAVAAVKAIMTAKITPPKTMIFNKGARLRNIPGGDIVKNSEIYPKGLKIENITEQSKWSNSKEYYRTASDVSGKKNVGFLKADLDTYIAPPTPDPLKMFIDKYKVNEIPEATLFTPNSTIASWDLSTGTAFIGALPLNKSMTFKYEATANGKKYYLTQEQYDARDPKGVLQSEMLLQPEDEPTASIDDIMQQDGSDFSDGIDLTLDPATTFAADTKTPKEFMLDIIKWLVNKVWKR